MATHSSILAWKIPLSQTYIYLFFDRAARGLLVPQPGIKPKTLHWMGTVLTTGLPGKSLKYWFYYHLGVADRSGDDCQLKALDSVILTDTKMRGHATFLGGIAKWGNTGISKEESESENRSVVSNSL